MRHKSLFVAFLALLWGGITVSAQTPLEAKNAYAYDVQVTPDDSYQIATITYRLNAPADAVKVIATVDGVATEYDGTTTATVENNLNTVQVPIVGTAEGKTIKFSVKVTSPVLAEAKVCEKMYSFWHPQGVAVDNNPESPYFGRVYSMDARFDIPASGYHSSADREAIYVFDPLMNPIKTKDGKYGFTGGLDIKDKYSNGTEITSPRKVRISKDGRVFVSTQNEDGVSIYEINPADLDATWTPVIYGTPNAEKPWLAEDAEGNFITAPNVSFDVKGEGENLQIITLSDYNPGGLAFERRVDEYNLGTAASWNKVPSKNIEALSGKYSITGTSINIVYDNDGGIWYFQYRGTPTDAEPAIVHINAEGVEDYKGLDGNLRAGGVSYSPDRSLLAYANATGKIGVYTESRDTEGKPVLTEKYSFTTGIGNNCNDIAWDLANNLYIVGNSKEKIATVALPRESGDVVTPAAKRYDIKMPFATPRYSGDPIYFKVSSKWKEANPRFAVYCFGGSEGEEWIDCTLAPNETKETGIYTVTLEADKWETIILARMNPGTTENNWDNKWNQSADLKAADATGNYYVITGEDWDKPAGEWQTYVYVEPTYTVVGDAAIFGTDNGWKPELTENDMTEGEEGIYTLVKKSVTLATGSYEYKVAYDHSWAASFPSQNAKLEIAADDTYTITFTYEPKAEKLSATAEPEGPVTALDQLGVTDIRVIDRTLVIETAANTPLQVYNVHGQLLYNATAVQGTTRIAGLPTGIAIVRAADKVAKVSIR